MVAFLVVAMVVTGMAAVTDWRTGHIPNWLTLGALALAPFAHIVYGLQHGYHGSDAFLQGCYSLVGAAVTAIVPLILYRQDAIGAGDVKLLLALGALLKWQLGFEAELYAFFAAGILAPARLAYEGKLFATIRNTLVVASNPFLPKAKQKKLDPQLLTWVRFGPAIFLGSLLTTIVHWRD
jgi:prepilin peptidase CpaA